MSESGSGFDWMSIFFLVIAGIASLFQALVKKKTQTQPTTISQEEIEREYQNSSTEDYFPETKTVEGYPNTIFDDYTNDNEGDEIVSRGDYYQAIETNIPEQEIENIDEILRNIPQVESPRPVNFNLKEAIIYSEVLKRKY